MIHSLLPTLYRATFFREKIFRLICSWLLLCIMVLTIGIVCMIPSYFIVVLSRDDVLRRLAVEEEVLRRHEIAAVEKVINDINGKLLLLEKNELRRRLFSNIVLSVINKIPQGIIISSIELHRGQDNFFTLSLWGVANTRDTLLVYTDRLKASEEVLELNAPVSNLLKETNVSFALEAKIKPEFYHYVPR